MPYKLTAAVAISAALALAPVRAVQTPAQITTPVEQFGHNLGDDYFLANYQQIAGYWQKLAQQSKRIIVQSIGKTAEGRTQFMAIVTSPENHQKLARYREISERLAHADGLTDDQARALAKEGKTVVWIDGGLHATEVLGAQQLAEMVYQMVSGNDEETLRLLNDVIMLFVHANPDGNDLVADWYMRNPDPTQRSTAGLPKLYQKYIGHDNNRDFFASTQPETENMNRVLYREWFPQILYNHHQSGPAGTILYSPPLRDPFNYNEDPLVVLGIEQIGNALHTRLAAEGKPGATMRSGGPYDGWWNGGLRNTAVFHNTIAILTEMIGSPTPTRVPLVLDRQLPTADLAYPVPPQEWHFRQSIDYSISCNRAILDIASRLKENFLFNRYVMGKHSIERGSVDTWTPKPHRFSAIQAAVAGGGPPASASQGGRGGGRGGATAESDARLWAALHQPEDRDPRGYILPSNQRDLPTATKFVNALLENGITVLRAAGQFAVLGKTYPAGSYVVKTAQAFRPHILDMFEPQDHPDNFPIPGGPPQRPYDNAGWTLAFQMGIEFDRILEPFDGPFQAITDWNVKPPAGIVEMHPGATGYYFAPVTQLDAFVFANRVAAAGKDLYRAENGAFATPDSSQAIAVQARDELGLRLGLSAAYSRLTKITPPRVGLWDQYGGSMDAGWTRWVLEQFSFKFDRVFAPQLDAGNLNAKYDVLIFADGAIGAGGGGGGRGAGPVLDLPPEYRDQVGSISADRTIPQLKAFAENGGTIIAIGSSATNLARHFGLPIENHLVENGQALPQSKFYVPGSVLRAHLDSTSPIAFGMQANTDVFFDNSPVWKLGPDAAAGGLRPVAWFDSKTPLRSGWAWGQAYLDGGVIAVDAAVGRGRVVLFGPEILQRGQPHATFKFLFNAIYAGSAR